MTTITNVEISGLNMTLNSIIAIGIVLVITFLIYYNYTRIYHNIYKNDPSRYYHDIRSWYNRAFEQEDTYLDTLVEDQVEQNQADFNKTLDDLDMLIRNTNKNSEALDRRIKEEIIARLMKYSADTNATNEQIVQVNELISKVSEVQSQNATALDEIKEMYVDKIYKYLDDLTHSLKVIQYQYNIASVTQNMNSARKQLEDLYGSIYGTMSKYSDFIVAYVDSNFKMENVPAFKTRKIDNNSNQNFDKINNTFMMAGYTNM